MDADKTPSKENRQYPDHMRLRRRKIGSRDLQWFLYGLVPVVAVGLVLICIGISVFGPFPRPPLPTAPEVPPTDEKVAQTTPLTPITPVTPTTAIPPITTTVPPTTLVTPTTAIPVINTTAPPTTPVTIVPDSTVITPTSPAVDAAAVSQAKELSPQFSNRFKVQFSPDLARGLDAVLIGGEPGQLAGMVDPVTDEKQKYRDKENVLRQVMGFFSLNDSRLTLESMFVVNKATFQSALVPLGTYMLACHPERPNDCIAVSLQRQEFQINPDLVSEIIESPVLVPTADYEFGSIKKCFKIFGRKICIKVF